MEPECATISFYIWISCSYHLLSASVSLCENLHVEQEVNPIGGSTGFISKFNSNLFGGCRVEEIELYLVYRPQNASHSQAACVPYATQNPSMMTRNHGVL
jgi:hypothetical protein